MQNRMALYQRVSRVRMDSGLTPRSPLGAQHVARSPERVEQPPLALAVDLAPEVADVDVDDVALGVEVEAPDVLGDHRPRQHAPHVAEEVLEERVLASGQDDAPLAAGDGAGGGVQGEVAQLEDGRALPAAA